MGQPNSAWPPPRQGGLVESDPALGFAVEHVLAKIFGRFLDRPGLVARGEGIFRVPFAAQPGQAQARVLAQGGYAAQYREAQGDQGRTTATILAKSYERLLPTPRRR